MTHTKVSCRWCLPGVALCLSLQASKLEVPIDGSTICNLVLKGAAFLPQNQLESNFFHPLWHILKCLAVSVYLVLRLSLQASKLEVPIDGTPSAAAISSQLLQHVPADTKEWVLSLLPTFMCSKYSHLVISCVTDFHRCQLRMSINWLVAEIYLTIVCQL